MENKQILYSKFGGYCTLSADEVVLERAIQEVELYKELISDYFKDGADSSAGFKNLYDELKQKFDPQVGKAIIASMEEKLSNMNLNERQEWEKYYALSLRSMVHISRPLYFLAGIKEVLSGTKKDLSSILEGSSESEDNLEVGATCIDYMHTLKFLADKIGISGEVKGQTYLPKVGHSYFLTDEGIVIDPMWARKLGGVLSFDEYKKRYPQWVPAPCQKDRK